MPEALARFDDYDIEDEAPARPRRRKSAAPPRSEKPARDSRRPSIRTIGVTLFVGAMLGIVVNATLMQGARHPAPIFAGAPSAVPAQQGAELAPAPAPSPRPADLGDTATGTTKAPASSGAALTNLIRATAGGQGADAPAPHKDQIASLLKGDAPQDKSSRIVAAQHALQKLGYGVKSDGSFGATTKQALERFERDRGLTVTGELNPRTVKALSSQSGVAIQ